MGKISVKHKKSITRITNKLKYPETINERVMKDINSGRVEGLVGVNVAKAGKNIVLESEIENFIPLSIYLGDVVSFREFLGVVHSVITIIKDCSNNMMIPENIEFDTDYIFIEPVGMRVKCILWPVVNHEQKITVRGFFENLVETAYIADKSVNDKVKRYREYFREDRLFSIPSFENLVLELLGRKLSLVENGVSMSNSASQSVSVGFAESKNAGFEYDPFAQAENPAVGQEEEMVICPQCGTVNGIRAVFCSECGSRIPDFLKTV